jgi:hypothetical protein
MKNGIATYLNLDEKLSLQLQNAFRILANPGDLRREQAAKVRTDTSMIWQKRAARGDWIRLSEQPENFLPEVGMLSFLGYRVGEMNPTPSTIRMRILEYILGFHLPPLDGPYYFTQWGVPQSIGRFRKLIATLDCLARTAECRRRSVCRRAIADWRGDEAALLEWATFNCASMSAPSSCPPVNG